MRQEAKALRRLSPGEQENFAQAEMGELVRVKIKRTALFVRKGTPDLEVAMSCLSGEFEPVHYLLPRDYAGVIVDAGGYIGSAALALHRSFPKARIITVEPSRENFDVLRKNVADTPQIEPRFGALVGGPEKEITLLNRGLGEWGFTVVQATTDGTDSLEMHSAPALRLADLVDDVSGIGLIKIDIEGAEKDLFEKDGTSLDLIPNIFVELHDRMVPGCESAFFAFSNSRSVVKTRGEKYLSIGPKPALTEAVT
jgi:FkbM family methyltransferase